MYCPECGTQLSDKAKSCTNCGRSLMSVKKSSGGTVSTVVKGIVLTLVLVLVAGASYVVALQGRPDDQPEFAGYMPQGEEWVSTNFDPYGIGLEIPGDGWRLYFDSRSQKIFEDDFAKLDISFLGVSLNPDSYRVDNKPEVFKILSQEEVSLQGWNDEALYTVVQGNENGRIVNKHQLFFKRDFVGQNNYQRTYTYCITMTFTSGREKNYAPIFRHVIESINLYEYN